MWLLQNAEENHGNAVRYIKGNGLTYTIARPISLKDAPLTDQYNEAKEGEPETSPQIARTNVAHFLLKVIHDPAYQNTSVGLCV